MTRQSFSFVSPIDTPSLSDQLTASVAGRDAIECFGLMLDAAAAIKAAGNTIYYARPNSTAELAAISDAKAAARRVIEACDAYEDRS